jgi:hypothetical protein
MPPAGTIEEITSAGGPSSAAPPGQCDSSASTSAAALRNTLHCSSDTGDSAAQFNQSVSAMPGHASGGINTLKGTADTLLLGSVRPALNSRHLHQSAHLDSAL